MANHWPKRCYKFPQPMVEKIERVVGELGISESEFVRRAVDDYLRTNFPADAASKAKGRS